MTEESFSFRWGIPLLDEGFTTFPNHFFRTYHQVISRKEWLFICHLATYKYESERGECRPSLATIAREMGYESIRSVQALRQSLEEKGLLEVKTRKGLENIYDFRPLSSKLASLTPAEFSPPQKIAGDPPQKITGDPPQKIAPKEQQYKKNFINKTPVTASPSGNGEYHLIDLDEEIRAGVQVARNQVIVSCPVCQAGVLQAMDRCPDCQAVIVWQGSKIWTSRYGSVKKYIRRLQGISLRPKTDYEQQFVRFFGRSHEFVSEKQAADVRWLQTHKPEAMLMDQIDWGVQNKRAWQQVVAAGKNPATLERHNARSRSSEDDYELSESEKEQVEESLRESERLVAEMEAAGGQEAWTEQLLAKEKA